MPMKKEKKSMSATDRSFFSAFVTVSKAISSTLNLNKVLELVVEHAVNSLDLKAGALSLWNKKENRLELIAKRNLSQEFLNKGPVEADKSIPDAITTKRPVVVPDVENDPQVQYPNACKREGIRSILSIPIVFKENVIGMLRLYDGKVREYTYREVEFITALAELGGIAIENARYMEKVLTEHKKEMEELSDWFNAMAGSPMLDG
jgi:GAF domain-containing protein